jgi:hypothetical protein
MKMAFDPTRSRRALRSSVREFGESLGSTPAEVASTLADFGVSGTPRSSTGCAIARYLRVIIGTEPGISEIAVSMRSVHISCEGRTFPIIVKLPRPISKFIRAFDCDSYPELIDPCYPGKRSLTQ